MLRKTQLLPIVVVLLALIWSTHESTNGYGMRNTTHRLCDGNRLKHIATLGLHDHNDLNETFKLLKGKVNPGKVTYQDETQQNYSISLNNIKLHYQKQSQTEAVQGDDTVIFSGGLLKIDYGINWEKKNLTTTVTGTAKGTVKSDPIQLGKKLVLNTTKNSLRWNLQYVRFDIINNNLTIEQMTPQSPQDYVVLDQMLNKLKPRVPTIKSLLSFKIFSVMYQNINNVVNSSRDFWKEKTGGYDYTFTSKNEPIKVSMTNYYRKVSLRYGLDVTLSQSILTDDNFVCGDQITPFVAYTSKVFGGLQDYINNDFLRSTLRYVLQQHDIVIKLNQQLWSSQDFQFTTSELLQIIPSLKRILPSQLINGTCKGLNDNYFKLKYQTDNSYAVSINFTCQFFIQNGTKKLISMNLPVDYEIEVQPKLKTVDFVIKTISGVPTFIEEVDFPVRNTDLAEEFISTILNSAIETRVFGSGFEILGGENPGVFVDQNNLLLYGTESENTAKASGGYDPMQKYLNNSSSITVPPPSPKKVLHRRQNL